MYVNGINVHFQTEDYWENVERTTVPGLPMRVGTWLVTDKLYRSSNGGETWELTPTEEIDGQLLQLIVIDSVLIGRYSTGTNTSELWRSTNVGETWTKIDLDIHSHLFSKLHYHDGIVTASSLSMIYFSRNAGESWDSVAFNVPDMVAVNTIYNTERFYTTALDSTVGK